LADRGKLLLATWEDALADPVWTLLPLFSHPPIPLPFLFFNHQQHRSSAQNSSGVHWCRRRIRFKEVPEKVPKFLEKVWEALVLTETQLRCFQLGFAARFKKISKNKALRLLGIPPKLIQIQCCTLFNTLV